MNEERMDGNGSAGREAIRDDIEATRARMGETLEELGSRLNPERLKQQARASVREATIGRVETMARNTVDGAASTGKKVTDTLFDNPIPTAMIVAGLGWLAWNSRQGTNRAEMGRQSTTRIDNTRGYENESTGVVDRLREKASNIVGTTQTTVSETTREQSQRVGSAFEQNPLMLGGVALALGVASGFAFPTTAKESEVFGAKRDEMMDKAREMVSEKKEQAQHVAERVVSEARSTTEQAAREEGLVS